MNEIRGAAARVGRRPSRRIAPMGWILLAALAAGCGGEPKVDPTPPPIEERRVAVKVVPVVTDNVLFSTTKLGHVMANRTVQLNFKTAGQLKEYFVEENAYVEADAKVATIDDVVLRANVEKAQLAVERLEAELKRLKPLVDKQMMPQSQYDGLVTQFRTGQTTLKVAEATLKWSSVFAPFSGIILKKLAVEGSFVAPGMPIAILIDIDTVRVELDFSDAEVRQIPLGKDVDVFCDAYAEEIFKGKIVRILPKVDLTTRMTKVELIVENPRRLLKPGMMIRTTIVTDRIDDVISVPVDALIWNGSRAMAYVVADERAVRRDLQLGKYYKDRVCVLTGLTKGEKLVVAGQTFLSDGAKVRLVD